jgi:hypothetical protein
MPSSRVDAEKNTERDERYIPPSQNNVLRGLCMTARKYKASVVYQQIVTSRVCCEWSLCGRDRALTG